MAKEKWRYYDINGHFLIGNDKTKFCLECPFNRKFPQFERDAPILTLDIAFNKYFKDATYNSVRLAAAIKDLLEEGDEQI